MRKWHLYEITTEDGAVYVGVSVNPKNRLTQHYSSSGVSCYCNTHGLNRKNLKMKILSEHDTEHSALMAETDRILNNLLSKPVINRQTKRGRLPNFTDFRKGENTWVARIANEATKQLTKKY